MSLKSPKIDVNTEKKSVQITRIPVAFTIFLVNAIGVTVFALLECIGDYYVAGK